MPPRHRLAGAIAQQLHLVKLAAQFFAEPLLHITDQTKLVHPEAGTLSTQGMNLNTQYGGKKSLGKRLKVGCGLVWFGGWLGLVVGLGWVGVLFGLGWCLVGWCLVWLVVVGKILAWNGGGFLSEGGNFLGDTSKKKEEFFWVKFLAG